MVKSLLLFILTLFIGSLAFAQIQSGGGPDIENPSIPKHLEDIHKDFIKLKSELEYRYRYCDGSKSFQLNGITDLLLLLTIKSARYDNFYQVECMKNEQQARDVLIGPKNIDEKFLACFLTEHLEKSINIFMRSARTQEYLKLVNQYEAMLELQKLVRHYLEQKQNEEK